MVVGGGGEEDSPGEPLDVGRFREERRVQELAGEAHPVREQRECAEALLLVNRLLPLLRDGREERREHRSLF